MSEPAHIHMQDGRILQTSEGEYGVYLKAFATVDGGGAELYLLPEQAQQLVDDILNLHCLQGLGAPWQMPDTAIQYRGWYYWVNTGEDKDYTPWIAPDTDHKHARMLPPCATHQAACDAAIAQLDKQASECYTLGMPAMSMRYRTWYFGVHASETGQYTPFVGPEMDRYTKLKPCATSQDACDAAMAHIDTQMLHLRNTPTMDAGGFA